MPDSSPAAGSRSALLRARLAVFAGAVLLGLVATAFARAGEEAQARFAALVTAHPSAGLVLPPLVFAAVVAVTRRWFPAARGSGIPQVMAAGHNPAAAAEGPLVALRTAAAKFALTIAMLIGGGAVGREGPTVQISAALMGWVHRRLQVPVTAGVIIAGGAAGVAAAFNTPLAGVAFAIEELASAFEQKVAVSVMAAVVISGMVSLGLAGDYVYFGAMDQHLVLAQTVLAAPLAGLVGGLAGGLFARALVDFPLARATAALRRHPVAFAAACGLVVAVLGTLSDGLTWGTGYAATRTLLGGGGAVAAAPFWAAPARFLAAMATALSGAPGGIFAPSLSVGAAFGAVLAQLVPSFPAGAVVMLGMAGYFTGVVRAPLTAAIILMEMTAERSMILPLFATVLIADAVSARVCKPKLYHALAKAFGPA